MEDEEIQDEVMGSGQEEEEVDEQPSNATTRTTTPTKAKAKSSIAPKMTPAKDKAKSSTVTLETASPKWIAKQEKQYTKNIEAWKDAEYTAACATEKQEAINKGTFVPTAPDYGVFVVTFPRDRPGCVAGYLHLRDV